MSTTTLNRPTPGQRVILTVSPPKYNFLMELLCNFDFVQVEQEEHDGDSRGEIISNLQQAARDVKLIREGKLEGRPAREFLKELYLPENPTGKCLLGNHLRQKRKKYHYR